MRRFRKFLWLLGVAALAGCGSAGGGGVATDAEADLPDGWTVAEVQGEVVQLNEGCLGNVWVPTGSFIWKMTGEVTADVAIVHLDGTPWPDVIVNIFDHSDQMPADQGLVAKGLTGGDGHFVATLVLPSTEDTVNVIANFMGAKNHADLKVQDGKVSVELGRE